MHAKDAEGIANSVDLDQEQSDVCVLFALTCLSENFGKLRLTADITSCRKINKNNSD